MSKIIKGGKIKVLSFDISRAKDAEEELFSPLQTFLPQKVWPEEPEGPELPEEPQERLDETESADQDPPQEPEEKEIDPLSIPEVAERLALLEQEAYEKGFAQGQKDGMELGRQQYESMAAKLKELLRSLEAEIERHVLNLEKPLLSLVKMMAEKVIHREISLGPEVLKDCLQEALQYVVEQSRVRLHLHPEDIEYMEDIVQELAKEFSRLKDFELVPDESLSRGGCLLETDFGLIDATYERKWREILQKLEI